ncbi:MAG: LON peptidase substrate-binding domain-containing protein [Candidatus Kapaibacterium sp.]
MEKLGLFPLNVVLFPDAVLPLHIFEDRYKKLINKCIRDKMPFGVNLMSKKKLFDIGCSAYVTNVIKRYEDGRMDINITGEKRYKLTTFRDGEDIFFIGEVEYFDDEPDSEPDIELLNQTVGLFNKIATSIDNIEIHQFDPEEVPTQRPSFYIAQKSGLTLAQRQSLLEITSENKRLVVLKKHLEEILPVIREAEKINNIIKYDGYLNPRYFKK